MPAIPILYTPRLILRPLTLADATRVQELAGDARIADCTARMPHPYADGVAEAWIKSHQPAARANKAFTFAITLAGTRTPGRENDPGDTGHLIGSVEVRSLPGAAGELGYWIGVAWQNKGFATEAARAVVDFGFVRRGYALIVADHFAENPASRRVLEKIGLAPTGQVTRGYFPLRERSFDVVHLALTREDWSRQRIIHRWKPPAPRQPALATT